MTLIFSDFLAILFFFSALDGSLIFCTNGLLDVTGIDCIIGSSAFFNKFSEIGSSAFFTISSTYLLATFEVV